MDTTPAQNDEVQQIGEVETQAAYEAPELTAIGTIEELTLVEIDGPTTSGNSKPS